jgi:hypothetical protein
MHAMNDKLDIGFLLAAEFSCFNAAFGLAHALEERGHNIVFFVGYKSMLWIMSRPMDSRLPSPNR